MKTRSIATRARRAAVAAGLGLTLLGTAGCGPMQFAGVWSIVMNAGLSDLPWTATLTGNAPSYGLSIDDTAFACFTQTCYVTFLNGTATSSADQLAISANVQLSVFPGVDVPGTFTFTGTGVDTDCDGIADEATGIAIFQVPDTGTDAQETLTATSSAAGQGPGC